MAEAFRERDAVPIGETMQTAEDEVRQGKRFSFGRNWSSFLETLDDSRIEIATQSLQSLLDVTDLSGRTFLDVGCGSGLFSLAARRLGAHVRSFDFDVSSVACAETLRQRFDSDPTSWIIEQGSALDQHFLQSLGRFDIVYSWGVLHHTGKMRQALENMVPLVAAQGKLAIALYNDQGWRSRAWKRVKQGYCSGTPGRCAVSSVFIPWFFLRTCALSVLRGRNEFSAYRRNRGMSIVHDWIDWLGGLPFEVARFEEVVRFYQDRGFILVSSKRTHRLGCNEYVFKKTTHTHP